MKGHSEKVRRSTMAVLKDNCPQLSTSCYTAKGHVTSYKIQVTLPFPTAINDSNELINGIKIYYVLASINSLNVRNVFKMPKYFK